MSNIKTILVPVDFSECSKQALARAGMLAKTLGATLHVVHVWELPDVLPPGANEGIYDGQLVGMVEKFASTKLHELVNDARAEGLPIAESLLETGRSWRVVVQLAREKHFDLIVLGTHGRRGLERALLGSVAEKVVRCSTVPVMTVHGAAQPERPVERILVPVDYSESSRRALDMAESLSSSLGAELDVVHVWDKPAFPGTQTLIETSDGKRRSLSEIVRENSEHEMQAFLQSQRASSGAALPHRLLDGEPAATLLAELERGAHDLVVMGTRGHTGLKHALLGSTAEKLVRFSPVSVLTVPLKSAD
jgi:nucleotide-binding universal stress UspA family protein